MQEGELLFSFEKGGDFTKAEPGFEENHPQRWIQRGSHPCTTCTEQRANKIKPWKGFGAFLTGAAWLGDFICTSCGCSVDTAQRRCSFPRGRALFSQLEIWESTVIGAKLPVCPNSALILYTEGRIQGNSSKEFPPSCAGSLSSCSDIFAGCWQSLQRF